MNVLGINVSEKLFKAWSKLLVYPIAPFFLSHELKSRVSTLHLNRAEFSKTIQDLSFHDSYSTYAVASDAPWVGLLSSTELQHLPQNTRLELLQLQAKLGRGQIYPFDDYKHLLSGKELERAHWHVFDFEGTRMLELSHKLWKSFSSTTQKQWLSKYITEDRSECLSGQLGKSQWKYLNKRYPAIKPLLGFTDKSGPNCFSSTIAALLDITQTKSVAHLWIQTETFLRFIKESTYHQTQLEANKPMPDASILLFHHNTGLQHACLYLGEGLVFNKDAQSWFAPRQILALETVLKSWKDCFVSVYAPR